MTRFVLAAALAVAPVAVAVAQSPAPLAQVSAHLRATTTMTANFAQTNRDGRTVTGTLLLKRPGKVRFQYEKGVPLLIVGDGSSLYMIDYQVRQVSRWPIGNSPLGVLLDPNRDLTRFAKVVSDTPGGPLVVEARDPKRPEFGVTTLMFRRAAGAPGGLILDGWTVVDAQNNRSSVRLTEQRFNVAVENDRFRWTDPRPRTLPGRG